MRLLDRIALEGVSFPAALFMFRKILFTLDGVLRDVAGEDVRIDRVMAREFLTRWLASFGLFHAPLAWADLARVTGGFWHALRDRIPSLTTGWPLIFSRAGAAPPMIPAGGSPCRGRRVPC